MGAFMNSLFALMLGWTRGLVASLWRLLEGDSPLLLTAFAKAWLPLCAAMILAGLFIDWLVWVIRWRPYHLLALRIRKRLGLEEKTERQKSVTHAQPELTPEQMREAWLPLTPPAIDEAEQQKILDRAEGVSDEELGTYPGMRYTEAPADETRRFDAAAQEETQRYAAVTREEPAPRTPEETETPEQAEYRRQLEEYERERERYERDLAEYRRKMAEYEAVQAAQAQPQENPAPSGRRRRRG